MKPTTRIFSYIFLICGLGEILISLLRKDVNYGVLALILIVLGLFLRLYKDEKEA